MYVRNPKVFVSYSWDNQDHKNWVFALTNELRKVGIDAQVDEFITQRNTVNLNRMMIEQIRDSDYTLIILTEEYVKKAESFKGGVGYETSLLVDGINDSLKKIIPIVRSEGNNRNAIPFYLKGVSYIDFSSDENFQEKFEELVYKILKKDRVEMEPLGQIPSLKSKKVTMGTLKKNADINNSLIPDLREITDKDKNKFMKESYIKIIDFLAKISEQTRQNNPNFDYELDVVTNKKSIIRYYINGIEKHSIKIWLGNYFAGTENILISYNRYASDNDNSWNEMIKCVINDDKSFKLKMTMKLNNSGEEKDAKEVATELWKEAMQYFK